ncbi:hypothetical protein LWI29_024630 [Acer saccharum]|uniref:non-specific serine/threonine protein kinase n=1 Tax=Acer saccharum TaxID=4024 RepID=A0AA39VYX6_ACESA|nr:hypothetical protein LWI29_024630 [Acer saccharum]
MLASPFYPEKRIKKQEREMEILKLWIFSFLGLLALTVLVHAKTQSGFISIDCGLPENSAYTDNKTGINYTSDLTFTEAGVSHNISSEYNRDTLEQPFLTVRSFPEGMKNCYTLKPALGDGKFLIRASFMYGNYDGQNKLPSFDLLLGADVWDSVGLADASTILSKEIIHVPPTNYIDVCLVNNGFKDDDYDRIWSPYTRSNWVTVNSSFKISKGTNIFFNEPPSMVMQTAAIPANGNGSLVFDWKPSDSTLQFVSCLHFAELDQRQANNPTRKQDIYVNGEKWTGIPFVVPYLTSFTLVSPLPPILNALELHTKYGVKRNWQGDPCAPVKFLWQGLDCSYPEKNSPRITSLDLSNNNLTGPVPDFLSELPFLTVLNLRGNNLQGSVPAGLAEKGKNGLLSLSLDGNPDLYLSTPSTKKKTIAVPVLASFLAVSVLVIAALSIMWILKTRSQGITRNKNNRSFELKNRRFSYTDVVRITNNFERIVGQGGFGTVYHGNLDDHTQVAVKMLSLSSMQGDKQFQTEVELLFTVHHKNLTTLVGYCDDGTNMGLIYEFMANGNLESHLLDDYMCVDPKLVNWCEVVTQQIITSKPAIRKFEERAHIIEWVSFMLEKGDIKNVVDPRLQGDFDMNSVWRAVEVAMACVSQTSAKRPTMNQVVIDLKESLAIEIARTNVSHETESRSISLNLGSELPPLAS